MSECVCACVCARVCGGVGRPVREFVQSLSAINKE